MNEALNPHELVQTPGNPIPKGLRASSFMTRDGKRLRYALCPSRDGIPRGTVILLQGRNEAVEKYFETIDDLSRMGFAVATFDWRGQGGSDRLLARRHKGHVPSLRSYVADLESFLQDIVLPDCRGPYAVLAHSMGGLVALHSSRHLLNRVERMVLSAPLIGLPRGAAGTNTLYWGSKVARLLGLGASPIRPWVRQGRGYTVGNCPLTSDPRRFERNRALVDEAPWLFLGSPTLSWLHAILTAMRDLDDSDFIAKLQVPTLLVAAGADKVVSSAATERLAWRMRSGHFLDVPYARHELMQEADRFREPFLAAVEAFFAQALPARRKAG